MPNSFRPVAFRLPLSDVAALAAATARALAFRWRRDRPLAFGFRLSLVSAGTLRGAGWTNAVASPARIPSKTSA